MRATTMEKSACHICPRCGKAEMNIYYPDNSDVKVGTWCEACDFKAFFAGDALVPVEVDIHPRKAREEKIKVQVKAR